MEQLTLIEESNRVEESKPIKATIKLDKKSISHLCGSRRKNPSLNWAAHIYVVLDELCPYLLLREPVIEAFHIFITSLQQYEREHQTYYFTKRNKYTSGIILTPITYGLNKGRIGGMPSRFLIHNSARENEITNDIYQHFLPLYELIKEDIIPILERKKYEHRKQIQLNRCYKELAKVNQSITKLKERYESNLEHLNRSIVSINNEISRLSAT